MSSMYANFSREKSICKRKTVEREDKNGDNEGMKRGAYNKSPVKIDGEPIDGLKRRPDGRFYSAAEPTVTFGKNPIVAVVEFAQWQFETGRSRFNPSVITERVKQRVKRRPDLAPAKPDPERIPTLEEIRATKAERIRAAIARLESKENAPPDSPSKV